MTPQQLTTSLENSKALVEVCKEKGIELPESFFGWMEVSNLEKEKEWKVVYQDFRIKYPAYTTGELGVMLYQAFEKTDWDLLYRAYGEVFDFKGTQRIGDLGIINLMRRPDMGILMLIYLIKNDLITNLSVKE